MPGSIDGMGLLAFIKQDHPALPVVISSGHLNPTLALASGAIRFLSKPYQVDEALDLIKSELDKVG